MVSAVKLTWTECSCHGQGYKDIFDQLLQERFRYATAWIENVISFFTLTVRLMG